MKNDSYSLIKRFDDDTLDQIRSRFDKKSGQDFMDRLNRLSDQIVELQKENVTSWKRTKPTSCARILELDYGVTNGDMSMLPKLMEIGNIGIATNAWEEKQKIVNDYLGPAFQVYFSRSWNQSPWGGRTMKDAIGVSGLKKSYGSNMVLRGLDFQIKQGEIFASARSKRSW